MAIKEPVLASFHFKNLSNDQNKLSTSRGKPHYPPPDGMVNIPIYLVWECWVPPNSILFADLITFNNGYMEYAHTSQRMSSNNNNNKRKQV